jgi:hypothetical protein
MAKVRSKNFSAFVALPASSEQEERTLKVLSAFVIGGL